MENSISENSWYLIKIGILILLIFLAKSCETVRETRNSIVDHAPLVLLISIDGFRYDYFDRAVTPVLDSLIAFGVKADALIPVFPSKTFPNHYSQVTGMYPENHGIISNRMYDSAFDEYFTIGSKSVTTGDGKWYGGEPVWVTAKQQGKISATMFWPGSEAEIKGSRPDYYFPFNGAISEKDRIDQVLEWMTMSEGRPHLITLYFELVDNLGHLYGPDAGALKSAIEIIDYYIGDLLNSLANTQLIEYLDLVIVSDHGMIAVDRARTIFLDDYIDLSQVEIVNWSPITEIIPIEGKQSYIFDQLSQANQPMKVYKKGHLPEDWRYNKHYRITPIVAVAEPGWSITSQGTVNAWYFYLFRSIFSNG
jgi:predicted AlkP superfamily pyrophosphatase or phosphodiesterase